MTSFEKSLTLCGREIEMQKQIYTLLTILSNFICVSVIPWLMSVHEAIHAWSQVTIYFDEYLLLISQASLALQNG